MTFETVARAPGEVIDRDPPFVPGPAGTHITIRGLTKYFASAPLYQDFDLDFPKGKIVSIFGPNGCGKSTLINMIAGLIPIDAGQILFDGKSLRDTKIGYVFQNYREALFPWLRTVDNIGYPLKLAGETPPEVAFSALDFEMTLFIREKLQDVFMRTNTTMILVSHDLEEAVYLADKVLLLTKRPTQVAEIVPFDAPRPRTTETLSEPSFIRTKARTLEIFQREVRK